MSSLRRTSLFELQEATGARFVAFAGWELPARYLTGVLAEHREVRKGVGMFDVSHMGQIETSGPQATALLQRLMSNDVERVGVGAAQYSVLCREDGGVLDDLFTYRLAADRYLTVTNAANHARDLAWFREHASGFIADVEDVAADYAMLAVQGPRARPVVEQLASSRLPARLRAVSLKVAGRQALVCGTGYTGEDGVELLLDPDDAPAVWGALLAAGAAPAGLGARDTLRLEACYHLYGNDLSVDRGPIEAGLGWCCKEDTGFIGAQAVACARAAGMVEQLAAFKLTAPGIPRAGDAVVGGGVVTSGSHSPCLGVGIGLAYMPTRSSAAGTPITIDVRGHRRSAQITRRPLYPPAA